MKGVQSEQNLKLAEQMSQEMGGNAAGKSILERLEYMNDLCKTNARQVDTYNNFIEKTWDIGSQSKDAAGRALQILLESPEMSEKLLSAFFYYDPMTGKTRTTRPTAYIGQFLDNIRKLMSDENRDDIKSLKTIIEAFDQLNQERAHIVNQQGKAIQDVADSISKADTSKAEDLEKMRKAVEDLNSGKTFLDTVQSSFKQIARGDAKTQDLVSVTGDTFGTNTLLKV